MNHYDIEEKDEDRNELLTTEVGGDRRGSSHRRITILVACAAFFLGLLVSRWVLVPAAVSPERFTSNFPIFAEIDFHKLHSYTFLPWTGKLSRYTIDSSKGGSDVENAWTELGVHYQPFLLPEQYGADLKLSKATHLFETPGIASSTASPGFPVHFQVLHQLHCLDLLRQALYFNYDYSRLSNDSAWKGADDEQIKIHIGHCVDELRQMIMCVGDGELLPYIRKSGLQEGFWPDFGRVKQCKNFESIRQWAERHQYAEFV